MNNTNESNPVKHSSNEHSLQNFLFMNDSLNALESDLPGRANIEIDGTR